MRGTLACAVMAVAIFSLALVMPAVHAQTSPALPSSVPLSNIEIQLRGGGTANAVFPYHDYRVLVRGTGVVVLEDAARDPREAPSTRTVQQDDVVWVVNSFLAVRFFDLPEYFDDAQTAEVRSGWLSLRSHMTTDKMYAIMTFALGPVTKTLRIDSQYFNSPSLPTQLNELRRRIWTMGGGPPDWWLAK